MTVANVSVWFMTLCNGLMGVYGCFNINTVFIVWLELNAVPTLRPSQQEHSESWKVGF